MVKALTVVGLMVVTLLAGAQAGEAQLVLYDSFDVTKIDPAKWQGSEGTPGALAPNTEAIRKIATKQLQLVLTSFGRTDSSTGTGGLGNLRLAVINPAPITAMQAAVTAKAATALGCAPANPTATRARVQIVGGFFNDGTSPAAGDRTGDILAGIHKVKDSINGNTIEAFVNRCTNATCTFPQVTIGFHQFATTWAPGIPDVLRVVWNPAANQFDFAVNPGTAGQELFSLPYAVSDTTPPVANFKQLAIANSVASCTAARKKASILGLFNDFMVNP